MSLRTEWLRFGSGREHVGFAAWPERAVLPLPAVIVIQEVWGVDAHVEDVTRRFAQAGYVAFAPDLYARSGARPAPLARERVAEAQAFLNQLPAGSSSAVIRDPQAREAALAERAPAERARLGETMGALFAGLGSGGMRLDEYVPPLAQASDFLRREFQGTRGRKVAAVGFCMGGGLAALLACHDPELSAAAIFYGSAPPEALLANIRCPVAGFYGELDKRITDAVPAFAAAMQRAGKTFEPHVYEGAQHAFFNDTRPSYDVRAARDGFARVLDLFRRTLA
ncbi:MAG: dienelactone hydrolase family protein [Gemmatimonadales bacterium]